MLPLEYLSLIVIPSLQEMFNNKHDRRLAYISCLTTFHLADYINLAVLSKSGEFDGLSASQRKKLFKQGLEDIQLKIKSACPDHYAVVEGMCNGLKHPERTNRLPGTEREVHGFALGIMGAGFGEGRWGGPGLAVPVGDPPDAIFIDDSVMSVLKAFRDCWPEHLTRRHAD